ncbi:MAG: divergent polysaccharide deacetylase family protein [Bacillota bacterium]
MKLFLENFGYACLFLFCLAVTFFGIQTEPYKMAMSQNATSAKIAIVIDDFGYGASGTEQMFSLSIPLSVAILPFSEFAEKEGVLAVEHGKEVLVHMPMEALTGDPSWVGSEGIFRTMTTEKIIEQTKKAFEILPMAVGLNNHMGSAIMEDERSLSAVFSYMQEKGDVFFLDSVTTAKSQGERLAKVYDVPFIKRDVFLDGTKDVETIKNNLQKAGEVALEHGFAVAIGHVGIEGGEATATALAEMIPILQNQGIEFVFLSGLV